MLPSRTVAQVVVVYLEMFGCCHHGTVVHLPAVPSIHLLLFRYPKEYKMLATYISMFQKTLPKFPVHVRAPCIVHVYMFCGIS